MPNRMAMGRINGENVTGAAFIFLSILFLAAGTVNPVIASVTVVFYVLVAAGVALALLGYKTYLQEQKVAPVIK